jgi:hypothetical protein
MNAQEEALGTTDSVLAPRRFADRKVGNDLQDLARGS